MRASLRTGSLLIAAGLLLPHAMACGGQDGPPASAYPALGEPAVVTLQSAGSGAPVALRWSASDALAEKVSMTVDMAANVSAMGQRQAMKMTLRLDGNVRTDPPRDDGKLALRMVTTDSDLQMDMPGLGGSFGDDERDMFNEMMRGITLQTVMDDRGLTATVEMSGSDALFDSLLSQMGGGGFDQVVLPLPEAPIAVGATWQALSRVDLDNLRARHAGQYELLALDGDQITVEGSFKLHLDGDVALPGMGAADLDVGEFAASGTLRYEGSLAKPMALKVAMNMTMTMEAEVSVSGQTADIDMDTTVIMSTTPMGPVTAADLAKETAPKRSLTELVEEAAGVGLDADELQAIIDSID